MEDYVLSIAIATYNRPHLVDRTIKELLTINDDRFEIVVTDDGNNIDFFKNQIYFNLKNFSYYQNNPSLKTFGNVLKSIEVSHSKYVFILMDRDFININCFLSLIDYCENNIFSFGITGLTRDKHCSNKLIFHEFITEYDKYYNFATDVKHHSGNIINKEYFDKLENKRKYLDIEYTSFFMYYHLMFDIMEYDKVVDFKNEIVKLPSDDEFSSDCTLISTSVKGSNNSPYFTPKNRCLQFESILNHIDESKLSIKTKNMLYIKLYRSTLIQITKVLYNMNKNKVELMRYGLIKYNFTFADCIREGYRFNKKFNKKICKKLQKNGMFLLGIENLKAIIIFFK